jgi:hypothetical protein
VTPLAVTITQKHNTVDSLTTTSPTIGAGTYYVYFGAFGLAYGTDTLIATATGYLPDTAFITVTTPKIGMCCMPSSATTTNPPASYNLYAYDSTNNSHYTMDTVTVQVMSSDTTVIKPVAQYVHIPKGQYYTTTTFSYVGPGVAHLSFSDSAASGYQPLATGGNVTVTGPSLSFSTTSTMLGMRQQSGPSDYNIQVPNNVASPLVITLTSTDPTVATVPATVTIPAGTYYAYFQINAVNSTGTIQIQATATGYGVPTPINVSVTQPKLVVQTNGTVRTTQGRQSITVYAEDANGNTHYSSVPLTVLLASASTAVASIDSASIVIPAGQYYNNHATWAPVAVGSTQITGTDTTSASYKYTTGTATVAVTTPSLLYSSTPGTLGIGQYVDYVNVQTPDNVASPTTIQFSNTGTAHASVTTNLTNTPITSVVIPSASYYSYFRLTGASTGTDSLVASLASPASNPATMTTVVGPGRIDPLSGWPTSLAAGDSVLITLYVRDPGSNTRTVAASTVFTLAPNSHVEFHSGGSVITTATVPANGQSVSFYLKSLSSGIGSATISATNYQSYVNTYTVP